MQPPHCSGQKDHPTVAKNARHIDIALGEKAKKTYSLQYDAADQGTLAASKVNKEQSANNGRNKLDHTENHGGEKALLLTGNANKLEQIGCVDGD